MPLTPNGKIDRDALPLPGPGDPGTHVVDRAVTSTEARLLRLWREVLRVESIGLRDDFFALGGHSLRAVQLFSRIERGFGHGLSLGTLFSHSTVEELARVLDGAGQVEPWRPLVPIRTTGKRKPLFLVHGLGGEVFGFRTLASHLAPAHPVYGIQGEGPHSRQTLPTQAEDLARLDADLLAAIDPEGPYVIGGYSSGGVMALELGQELFRRGRHVAMLVIIDGGLPPSATRPYARRHTLGSFVRQAQYWAIDHAMSMSAQSWQLDIRSKARLIAARLGLHAKPGADLRDRLGLWGYPVDYREYLERRYEAFLRYTPHPYPGRITLVRARSGGLFWPPSIVLDNAWRAIALGGLEVRYVATGHPWLLDEPHVRDLARHVQAALDRAGA